MKLPKETKWILVALGGLVVLMVIYYFWSRADKQKKTKESNEAIERANKEIDPDKLTITSEQADSFADKLYNAIVGPGTDFEAIKDTFKYLKSRSDVIRVAAQYKQRHGDSWFSGGSLWTDLQDDLSASQVKEINEILEYKNVEFRI